MQSCHRITAVDVCAGISGSVGRGSICCTMPSVVVAGSNGFSGGGVVVDRESQYVDAVAVI